MPFNIVSSWKKRGRTKSMDHINPWVYKPIEVWQSKDQTQSPPSKKRNCSSVFTLKEMDEATKGFSDKNLIGIGGFGRVYKGILKDGEVVAIKKMNLPTFKQADGEREFRVEVDILSRIDHPNLVTLIGYCADGKDRFLVYEYMPRGNLLELLSGELKIDWHVRLKIAIGTAKGLAYLHSASAIGAPIVHRDFKSSNILLNQDFDPKISDFGLAKLMPKGADLFSTTRVLGTFGYFDPEYALTGKVTLQSDVYAFGVVLLELLTGRKAIDLSQGPADQNLIFKVHQILTDRKRLRKIVDPEISKGSYTIESIEMFAQLASRCVSMESNRRPTMEECVKELQLATYSNMKLW
ncbi:hypothetical protein LUZ60_003206 [Juncus effusus]|nr:hypothetical protein LUZ60_003206 [Juncus effusus]